MTEVIAGVAIPKTAAVAEATRHIQETTNPLIFHHSRRVFIFGAIQARELGLAPDPELLYMSALFHDIGLLVHFSTAEQRFEIDGADLALRFLLDRGFSTASAEVVWTAIALHTTPGIPGHMGPEVAATAAGVLTDVVGVGLDKMDRDQLDEITAAHPRGDFKNEFLQALVGGLKDRPDTTYGTVNADVLEHFVPGFRRTSMVEFVGTVAEILHDSGLEPAQLCLELTETTLMDDAMPASDVLADLKDIGVDLSVDDFGTGYSSLSYLKRFPVDELKIDRSFVSNLGTGRQDQTLVAAMVAMGHALGLHVVAEGVETHTQMATLRALGCRTAQGYLFAKPMDLEQFTALLRTGLPAELRRAASAAH
jgi:hypothetical protein